MMKRIVLDAVLVCACVVPAVNARAEPGADLIGTWECRAAGAAPTLTPPIVWFGEVHGGGARAERVVDLDGFGGEVRGLADLAPDADGWWRVQPETGGTLMVKQLSAGREAGAMQLRFGAASYGCRRLPRVT